MSRETARPAWVYILASRPNGTLYVGVTSDLIRRIWQHKTDAIDGFTSKYGVKLLVYFEAHASIADAILREKQIKEWKREWKIGLIERDNPVWRDRYEEILGGEEGKQPNSSTAPLDSGFRRNDE